MRNISIAIALLVFSAAYAEEPSSEPVAETVEAAEEFGFKQYRMGAPYEDFVEYSKSGLNCPQGMTKVGIDLCTSTWVAGSKKAPTIAGLPIYSLELSFLEKKLVRIDVTVPNGGYSDAVTALSTKYGAGESSTITYKNRLGASFDAAKHTWVTPKGTLVATQSPTAEKSARLAFVGDAYIAHLKNLQEAQRAKGAGDL